MMCADYLPDETETEAIAVYLGIDNRPGTIERFEDPFLVES